MKRTISLVMGFSESILIINRVLYVRDKELALIAIANINYL